MTFLPVYFQGYGMVLLVVTTTYYLRWPAGCSSPTASPNPAFAPTSLTPFGRRRHSFEEAIFSISALTLGLSFQLRASFVPFIAALPFASTLVSTFANNSNFTTYGLLRFAVFNAFFKSLMSTYCNASSSVIGVW